MSRVLGVVDRAIMVSIYDVVPGDILNIRGTEADPIIEKVEREGDFVRYHYKQREDDLIQHSMWLDKDLGPRVFIHDLKNEKAEFYG